MSAFGFINTTKRKPSSRSSTKSTSLSASLANDLHEEQFASFVNQQPHHRQTSTTPPSPSSVKSSTASLSWHPSLVANTKTTQASRSPRASTSPSSSLASPSAFAFISAGRKGSPLQKQRQDSNDEFQSVLFDSSSHVDDTMAFAGARSSPRKQRRQPTAQISHLSAETTCKRIQAEKDHERDLITRLYQRRAHVYQQIDEYHRTLDELDTQLRHAMQSEAFLEADEIRKRREQIETKLWDMFISTERQLDDQIQQAWDRFASLLRRDAEAADQVVETSREVKSERERQILQYRIDCEQKCEQRLQRIHAERDGMEQEKSQIAFDLEMWEHADNDFKARMDELVHDDKAHKTDLLAQADTVQAEIVELKERLQNLSRQHADLLEQVETLDARMQAAVQPYASEQNALHADYNQVQQRKQDLDARTAKLDLEDEDVHAHLDRMRSEEQRGQQELDALEDMILRSQRTADEGRAKTEVMTVLGDVLKARDSLVSEKKGEMARARNELQAQKNELTRLRQDAFGLQCLVEESEATVHQLASQMGRLQRQKVLAVETGQLVKAAQAAENLNKVEQRYAQAETSRSEHKETLDKKLELLRDQKKRLEQAETDHAESVHQATQDLILGLRKAERALSDVQESALLQDLIDLEKEHMRAQIESLQRHLVKEPAVNLLSLDDDTTTDNSTQHHQGD